MTATAIDQPAPRRWPLLRVLTVPLWAVGALWRRSIQARVVIGTLVLSAMVAALVGWVVMHQIADGLLDSKRKAALSEATAGFVSAQQEVDAAGASDQADPGQLLTQLVAKLASRGGESGLYGVVLTGPLRTNGAAAQSPGSLYSIGIEANSIPAALREQVANSRGAWWAYTRIRYDDPPEDPSVPGLAVGSQLQLAPGEGAYGLYYVFPLAEQEQTLGLVQRALATAGALLVALLAAVAYLVTRQVVTPVRLARRIAERLAAGRLEERMHVRGEDDIARLGTSFNQMAAGLQRQIRQLEELSRTQRRFASDVSHELRTPLTTVRMAADVLHDARDGFDPVTARAAELLQNELNRFESLLIDLLEISRFDAGAAVLDVDEVDLADVAQRVVDSAQPLAQRRRCRLLLRTPGHPCTAQADVRRIERILRNLVVNAIEHGEGRDVVITVASTAEAAAVSVRDHGVGLASGESALVFDRFWRADPARARTTGGTGLGLAIALEDAHLHGGWLQAWGEPGRGAHFRLTLPRRVGARLERSPLPLVPADAAPIPVAEPAARADQATATAGRSDGVSSR